MAEACSRGTTDREKAVLLAAKAWREGHQRLSAALLEGALRQSPADALLVRLLHDIYFFLGDNLNLRNSVARCMQSWDPSMPGYGFVSGMLSFGFEECLQFDRAEDFGMQAVNLNPEDSWAVHAVAHVYEMTCRSREGKRFLRETREHWEKANLFNHHIHWHWALFNLEDGEYQYAMGRYDGEMRPMDRLTAAAVAARAARAAGVVSGVGASAAGVEEGAGAPLILQPRGPDGAGAAAAEGIAASIDLQHTHTGAMAMGGAAGGADEPIGTAEGTILSLADDISLLWRMRLLQQSVSAPLQGMGSRGGSSSSSGRNSRAAVERGEEQEETPRPRPRTSFIRRLFGSATEAPRPGSGEGAAEEEDSSSSRGSRGSNEAEGVAAVKWSEVQRGMRWHHLHGHCLSYLGQHVMAFNDIHLAMLLAAVGDEKRLAAHLSSMRAYAAGADAGGRGVAAGAAVLSSSAAEQGAAKAAASLLSRPFSLEKNLFSRSSSSFLLHPSSSSSSSSGSNSAGGLLLPLSLAPAPAFQAQLTAAGAEDNRQVTAMVGLDMAEGMAAFWQGRYSEAVLKLVRSRSLWQMVGGSHAQRDVFEQTLIHACLCDVSPAAGSSVQGTGAAAAVASHNRESLLLAEALLSERVTTLRFGSSQSWYLYGSCLELLGDSGRAMDAKNRAYALGLGQGVLNY